LHQEEKVQAVEGQKLRSQRRWDLVEEALLQEKEVLAEEVQSKR
jgi:hypothetical protein